MLDYTRITHSRQFYNYNLWYDGDPQRGRRVQYLSSSRVVNSATVRCCKQSAVEPWQVGSTHRWSLYTVYSSKKHLTVLLWPFVALRCYATDTDIVTMEYTRPTQGCHLGMTSSDLEWLSDKIHWHEASRGLCETAELVVCLQCVDNDKSGELQRDIDPWPQLKLWSPHCPQMQIPEPPLDREGWSGREEGGGGERKRWKSVFLWVWTRFRHLDFVWRERTKQCTNRRMQSHSNVICTLRDYIRTSGDRKWRG